MIEPAAILFGRPHAWVSEVRITTARATWVGLRRMLEDRGVEFDDALRLAIDAYAYATAMVALDVKSQQESV
jgi:hypothetical protein